MLVLSSPGSMRATASVASGRARREGTNGSWSMLFLPRRSRRKSLFAENLESEAVIPAEMKAHIELYQKADLEALLTGQVLLRESP